MTKSLLGTRVGVTGKSWIIGFSTPTGLPLLRGASTWLVDVTFSVAPTGVSKLWVVHAQIGAQCCPWFSLMEHRTQEDYLASLDMILQELNLLTSPNTPVAAATRGFHCVNHISPKSPTYPSITLLFWWTLRRLRATSSNSNLLPGLSQGGLFQFWKAIMRRV